MPLLPCRARPSKVSCSYQQVRALPLGPSPLQIHVETQPDGPCGRWPPQLPILVVSPINLKTLEAYVAISKPPGPWDLIVPALCKDGSELRSCSELSGTSHNLAVWPYVPVPALTTETFFERAIGVKVFPEPRRRKAFAKIAGNMNIGELGCGD